MSEEKAKRVRRTPEQLAADIDLKIAATEKQIEDIEAERVAANAKFDAKVADAKAKIKALSEKKKALLAPKPPRKKRVSKRQKMQDLIKQAEKSGLKLEEIAERLGISIEQ